MVLDTWPAITLGPITRVATRLLALPSSSSQVISIKDVWVVHAGDVKMLGRLSCSHVSPVETEQSCMSWHRFGVMKT